ncbi:uncharacterized protein [Littorina saxatilis]|uniref:uncharacterized protein n=1 Tax=Littorina saxatilis TaxID=31220 RepID=UPI0038B6B135
MQLIGFKTVFNDDGTTWLRPERVPDKAVGGGEHKGELLYLRNHPTIVHHIAELLTIWGANIECRTVNSYRQVLNYLLKYMYKNEPDSQTFQTISKAIIDNSGEEVPVRKAFQQILMKTLKEHDLSKQECARILTGGDFVQTSRDFVYVNVTGTRKVKIPTGTEGANDDMLHDDFAVSYWNRQNDDNYKAAVEKFKSGQAPEDPECVSLFDFASKYTKKWRLHGLEKVPHFTPNFKRVPNKHSAKETDRYLLFLKTILLVYKPGTKIEDFKEMQTSQIEAEVQDFVGTLQCPNVIREEFTESQVGETDNEADDSDTEERCNESDLLVQPDEPILTFPQEPWMELLCPLESEEHHVHAECEEGESDFNELVAQLEAENTVWQSNSLHQFTPEEVKNMPGWIEDVKKSSTLPAANMEGGGLPEQLNDKQLLAFKLLQQQIQKVVQLGINKAPQLLLNISGSAGTGKSFWLNCLRKYVKDQQLSNNFIKTAAPSGTAAFQIGGETLHGMLHLPIGNGPLTPLTGSCQSSLQEVFKETAILVIDEKSMIGQKTFFFVSERLKEAKPRRGDEPFGGITVVLLGDWRQLPPVMDRPLYRKPCKEKSGNIDKSKAAAYNLYQLFQHSIIFETVERQAGEDQMLFRSELGRLAEGRFSVDDWERWKEREFDLLSPEEQKTFHEEAVMGCARKKDMLSHNIEKGSPMGLWGKFMPLSMMLIRSLHNYH